MFVDVLGTLDECRFTYEGVHVSKEVARQFYKKTAWYAEVEAAKKEAEAKCIADWKALVKTSVPKLDLTLKEIIKNMYMAAANEMTGQGMFKVPKMKDVISSYKKYAKEQT